MRSRRTRSSTHGPVSGPTIIPTRTRILAAPGSFPAAAIAQPSGVGAVDPRGVFIPPGAPLLYNSREMSAELRALAASAAAGVARALQPRMLARRPMGAHGPPRVLLGEGARDGRGRKGWRSVLLSRSRTLAAHMRRSYVRACAGIGGVGTTRGGGGRFARLDAAALLRRGRRVAFPAA